MATIVRDCPRCGSAKMTHDVRATQYVDREYDWLNRYESYCVCRACSHGTIFYIAMNNYTKQTVYYRDNGIVGYNGDITNDFRNDGYVSLKDRAAAEPPESLPNDIDQAYREATRCLLVEAFNGAGAMFRLCLDLATKPLLPSAEENLQTLPNEKQRRDLGLRLSWLFENGRLPESLRDLAKCIREDANDAAHTGALEKADSEDMLDFTFQLLDRLISEPARIKTAEERRIARRAIPK